MAVEYQDAYATLEFLQGKPADEIAWLFAHGREAVIAEGTFFFREGMPSESFYLVLEGEMQVTRSRDGVEKVMGTTPAGVVGGELSLLFQSESNINACALVPTRLLILDEPQFRAMFGAAPTLAAHVLRIATGRAQGYATNVVQQEKMAALGKLSAGLAHELNNPAAAVRRAADTLNTTLPVLQRRVVNLNALGLTHDQIAELATFQQSLAQCTLERPALSALELSDREDELGDWLAEHEVAQAWELAATFAHANITRDKLATAVQHVPAAAVPTVLEWLATSLDTTSLLTDIQQSANRISDLVLAIKNYTYRDQGKVQDVDINKGLDTTLSVLGYKLKKGSIQVERRYDPNLPIIAARGGELNQVWTNLIDNAVDALNGAGNITLVTRSENGFVMVEVADNGPGIPPDVRPRIFEPFFTTKDVGSGTGLGLDISYRIIEEHHGSIEVDSRPGLTRFIIRLPITPARDPAAAVPDEEAATS